MRRDRPVAAQKFPHYYDIAILTRASTRIEKSKVLSRTSKKLTIDLGFQVIIRFSLKAGIAAVIFIPLISTRA